MQEAVNENQKPRRYEDGFRVLQGRREYVTYPDDSSFRMWFSDIPWRYETHEHSAVEIALTLEGVVDYVVNDSIYQVRKGEILIIPSDAPHMLDMGANSSRLLFLFEPDPLMSMRDIKGLNAHINKVFFLHDGSEAHIQVREMLHRAADIYRKQDLLWNTVCYSYMLRIYSVLAQKYLTGVHPRRQDMAGRSVDSEVINASMVYINNHYREDLSLDDVAEFAGFSRYYFSRSFKKQTGYSFKDYLCNKRLQVAMDLLIRTRRPMREVALDSGFGSVATFNRVFRENKGCTPTQYRAIYGTY